MATLHPVFNVPAQFQAWLARQGGIIHNICQCGRCPNKEGGATKRGIHVTKYRRLFFCVSIEIWETDGVEGAIDLTG